MKNADSTKQSVQTFVGKDGMVHSIATWALLDDDRKALEAWAARRYGIEIVEPKVTP